MADENVHFVVSIDHIKHFQAKSRVASIDHIKHFQAESR